MGILETIKQRNALRKLNKEILEAYADDPDVVFTKEASPDRNGPHGINSRKELDSGPAEAE